jgi:hypothetical protein
MYWMKYRWRWWTYKRKKGNRTLNSGGRTTWGWVGYEPFIPSYDDMLSASLSDHFTICKVPAGRLKPYKNWGAEVPKVVTWTRFTNCPGLSVIRFKKIKSRGTWDESGTKQALQNFFFFPVITNTGKRKFASKTRIKCGRVIVVRSWMLKRLQRHALTATVTNIWVLQPQRWCRLTPRYGD